MVGLDVGGSSAGDTRSHRARLHFPWFRHRSLGNGVLLLLGLSGLSLPLLLVIFAVLSLVAYLAMRKVFGLKTGQVKIWDRDIND